MNNVTKAHLGLLTTNLIYGGGYLVAKGLMPHIIGPSGFILLRVLGAGLLFWTLNIFGKGFITNRKDLGRIAICGFFGVAANQLLFFNGLNLTSPINSSIIMTSNPIMVMLISALILKTKVSVTKWFGVALGALGAVLLIWSKEGNSSLASPLGDLLIFLNALSYGIYLIVVKPLMSRYSPLQVIAHVFAFGLLFVLPFGWEQFGEVEWGQINQSQWLAFAYIVLGVSFLNYLLNIFSLKHVSPSVTSTYIYLQPVFATLISYAYAHFSGNIGYADLTLSKILYTVLIFIGVYLVSKPTRIKESEKQV